MALDPQKMRVAAQSYVDAIEAIQRCVALYKEAGMAIPHELNALLSGATGKERPKIPFKVPSDLVLPTPPDRGTPPKGAESDWIAVPVSYLGRTSVASTILRAMGPLPHALLHKKIEELMGEPLSSASFYSGIQRMKGEGVVRLLPDERLALVKPERGPILQGTTVWAHPSALTGSEVATYRREAIWRMLLSNPPLRIVDIAQAFQKANWKTVSNKDAIKADMAKMLEEGKVDRTEDGRWRGIRREEDVQKPARGGLLNFA